MTDLLALTAELVDIPSVSHDEGAIAGFVESELRRAPGLEVARLGDNVIARTALGRAERVVLAGHLDTVPPTGKAGSRVEGDVCYGVGSVDMKGGVAVLLALAQQIGAPRYDLTYVLYACEEVERRYSGIAAVDAARPDLLTGDVALLLEPTGSFVEAGCQGVMRLVVTTRGTAAHVARPSMGDNALHRLGAVLARAGEFAERRPVLDGCEYRESLQVVWAEGGSRAKANVIPDRACALLSHRFAPDRDAEQARESIEALIGPALEYSRGDSIEIEEVDAPAPPRLAHPILASLVAATGAEPRAKLGWTDVSHFAARGLAATNFGPGDPLLCHHADERVSRGELDGVYAILRSLLDGA
ncbi:MAG TPA: succinyl-diaminopimelate desuccinylase [Acidimicrobiales bacterium]|nr:succinyl-diaminopimelate desuccinylase [Acidimicrobiales bacterium]